jgi:4-amino-4-deoxy-L-arabinose transferase-like glycosyltransferase
MKTFQTFNILICAITFITSIYFFNKKNNRASLFCLFISAFTLRLVMISLDIFLHDWDERFHALVAKNMIVFPFKPMLRINPVLDNYDYTAWCCNHIWLHKQPLFLWQMALSMKLFGVNMLALRLPSALMGALLVFPTYQIGQYLFSRQTGYFAAVILTFAYYQLELISGAIGMDHNDIAFLFYVIMSIWAYYEYQQSSDSMNMKWIFLIGFFSGCAILCKWLTGLLVYSGWGMSIILQLIYKKTLDKKQISDFFSSLLVTTIIFIPWQIYIHYTFSKESNYERAYNTKHVWQVVENHSGSVLYYVEKINLHYGNIFYLLIFIGLLLVIKQTYQNKIQTYLGFIIIPYFFFSIIAQTKLPTYVYFISPLVIIILGKAIEGILTLFYDDKHYKYIKNIFIVFIAMASLRLEDINKYRHKNISIESITKQNNTEIYKQLNQLVAIEYSIWNCKSFEDVEAMFFSDRNVYSWCMNEDEYKILKSKGIKIAVFKNHTNQYLPKYLTDDTTVLIIDKELK